MGQPVGERLWLAPCLRSGLLSGTIGDTDVGRNFYWIQPEPGAQGGENREKTKVKLVTNAQKIQCPTLQRRMGKAKVTWKSESEIKTGFDQSGACVFRVVSLMKRGQRRE